ncbi:unnamed protein product [Albugo candida]|nr:unnamed protein product [Albugo candida]|eukprot:CCI41035.1 unnamed protein product [Albugo candida]
MFTRKPSVEKKSMQKIKGESIKSTGSIAIDIQHPYLDFIQKRKRSYKKKLDKITILEAARADGKVLNEQQKELVSGKPMLERLLLELDMVRDQFIELETDKHPICDLESPRILDKDPIDPPIQTADSTVGDNGDEHHAIEDLLEVLHIVDSYRGLQQNIPTVLDYYSQVLLGKTRPPAELSFEENLVESVAVALRYAQKSDMVFACDTTYAQLNGIVTQLVSARQPQDERLMENKPREVSPLVPNHAIVSNSGSNEHPISNGSLCLNRKSPAKSTIDDKVACINFFTDSTINDDTVEEAALKKEEQEPSPTIDMENISEAPSLSFAEAAAGKPSAGKWNRIGAVTEEKSKMICSRIVEQNRPNHRRRYQARPKQNSH